MLLKRNLWSSQQHYIQQPNGFLAGQDPGRFLSTFQKTLCKQTPFVSNAVLYVIYVLFVFYVINYLWINGTFYI